MLSRSLTRTVCRGGAARRTAPNAGARALATASTPAPAAAAAAQAQSQTQTPPVSSDARSHKVVVIGGGSAGLSISHQLLHTGKFKADDIAVVDPAEWHHYQPGWTLVGGGVKNKADLRRPLRSLIDPELKFYNDGVGSFVPEDNTVKLVGGDKITYDQLVVAPGIAINYDAIKGLPEALADQSSLVSTVYGYDTCDKTFRTVQRLEKGQAIFTMPAGPIKCAGAPQKVMWLALDHWKKKGLYSPAIDSPIKITFATGIPAMFGVPKYSAKLEELRKERGVEGLFQHDLVSVDGDTATFARPNGQDQVKRRFDLLHVVPKMGPHAFVKNSPLADAAGFVDVDDGTTQHRKFANVWSAGDASSLPTSKTTAAITSQAPVLVGNVLRALFETDAEKKKAVSGYDGYTSCPLTTEYGKVLLAEFKYGGVPKETFGDLIGFDQAVPRRAFWHLKKDFFPWVYYASMVKGTWGGPKGWISS